MRSLTLLVLLAVLGQIAQLAGAWQLDKVQMVSQTNGWALAHTSRGSILLRTSDGGRDWQNVSPKGIWPLSPAQTHYNEDMGEGIDISFLSAQTGWLAMYTQAEQITVERTQDGGRHWAASRFRERMGYTLIVSFRDARHGFILTISDIASGSTKKTLYRSNDGGKTWGFVTQTIPDHIDPNGLTF